MNGEPQSPRTPDQQDFEREPYAVISADGVFRYELGRPIAGSGIVIAFFGVNPSTAGPTVEDQTTMKWRGFALRNGARRYIAGNPFAFRATNVRTLAAADDPIGPENEKYLRGIIRVADLLVPCWGSRGKLPPRLRPRLDWLARLLRDSDKPVKVFGLTASGDPMHPLMLGYDTPLVDWGVAA